MKALLAICSFLLIITVIVSCQSEQQVEFNRYYSSGAAVYQKNCQNCHGDQGQGLAALIPPLTDQGFLKKNKRSLTCIIQLGLSSKIKVKGVKYESKMPAVDLSPIEIAQVTTYITNSFGNKLGLVTNDDVLRDLKHCTSP